MFVWPVLRNFFFLPKGQILENVDFLYNNNKKIIQIKDHVADMSDTDFSGVCTD